MIPMQGHLYGSAGWPLHKGTWLRGGPETQSSLCLPSTLPWRGTVSAGRKGCLFLTGTKVPSGLAVALSKPLGFLLCGLVSRVYLHLFHSSQSVFEQIFVGFLLCVRHWVYIDEQTNRRISYSHEAYSVLEVILSFFLHENWRAFFWGSLSWSQPLFFGTWYVGTWLGKHISMLRNNDHHL